MKKKFALSLVALASTALLAACGEVKSGASNTTGNPIDEKVVKIGFNFEETGAALCKQEILLQFTLLLQIGIKKSISLQETILIPAQKLRYKAGSIFLFRKSVFHDFLFQ